MTIGTLNQTTTQATDGVIRHSVAGAAAQQGFPPELADIHPALEEVRQLKEFQPPQPSWMDDFLKQPWVKALMKSVGDALEQILKGIRDLFSHLKPEGMPHLPQNIRDIFSGFIGFILVLAGLYAFYLVLTLFLKWNEGRSKRAPEPARFFEETKLIDSAHHYQQAQQAAQSQDYELGIRQLYMATLCFLDEKTIIPYEATRTNLEYQKSLMDQFRPQMKSAFSSLAQRFEAVRYGQRQANRQQFDQTHQQFQAMQSSLPVSDA